jgi:hypothetical protein
MAKWGGIHMAKRFYNAFLFETVQDTNTYFHKLSPDEQAWMRAFIEGTTTLSNSLAVIAGPDYKKLHVYSKIKKEYNPKRRDFYGQWHPAHFDPRKMEGVFGKHMGSPEDAIIDAIDEGRRVPDYSRDYGNISRELLDGEVVRVCMFRHVLERMTGQVLERRGEEYLIGVVRPTPRIAYEVWAKPRSLRELIYNEKFPVP